MPFHFCTDELLAIMMVVPFVGVWARKLYVWWHSRCKCPSHEEHEGHEHRRQS
jgi:hypothetical protein